MEYNHAVQRGIPRLIFLMHEDHPLTIKDVEQGEEAGKLKKLLIPSDFVVGGKPM
jgi:hypothetical protein